MVTAPPGAGKSTVLPLELLPHTEGRILMLEPRRLAARHIAERMAFLMGEPVGETVGYRVRFDSKLSPRTRIEVLTEGILTRMLLEDPSLEGVGMVIFDEFHERSIVSDEALALTRQVRQLVRPDLKILIMSATINAEALCSELGCPHIKAEGRLFPVEVRYAEKAPSPGRELAREVAAAVSRLSRERDGDILVFLPGEADIRRCAELLEGHFDNIRPLYGNLPHEQQRRALEKTDGRKIVLATPVAETSVTIEGVSIVIDSGYCRRPVFDPRSALSHLETVRISRDMADQRCGRAGRTGPGLCLRLWPASERLQEVRTPEIQYADLVPLRLDLAVWGTDGVPWLTAPDPSALNLARKTLEGLGAVAEDGTITEQGRTLSRFPCHPRIANMLLRGRGGRAAATIAAILEDKDPCPSEGADITLRLDKADRKAVEQFTRLLRTSSAPECDDPGLLLAAAYPERVGKAAGNGEYMLSGGAAATLDPKDPLCAYEWLSVASVEGGRIRLAAPVDPRSLPLKQRRVTGWDARERKIYSRQESVFGKLVVDSRELGVGRAEADGILCEAAGRYGVEMFDFASQENLRNRVAAARAWHPELDLPSMAMEDLLDRAREWVPLASQGRTSAQELRKVNLEPVLLGLLSYEQSSALERIAPECIVVPTGSRIRLEYRTGADAPVLRVRLQECFGLEDTPTVDGGRRPVLMELLSPGFKPVQLTCDLRSFWRETYFEVRKELRRRYPRHSWPDNPLEAEPVRGVRKK